jgi:uncharacterized membrane protein YedE/YeeE
MATAASPAPARPDSRPVAGIPLATAAGATLVLGTFLATGHGWRQAALLLIGIMLGITLYHARFGFTGAFRALVVDGRTAGLRAQMAMLALGSVIVFPLLAKGTLWGQDLQGFVAPVGISLAFGATLFGAGMQLGGGCASGTLFTAGGGDLRMVLTLVFFIVGSVVGTAHAAWWHALPALPAVTLATAASWPAGLALNLAGFAAIAAAGWAWERRRHGRRLRDPEESATRAWSFERVWRGPWPLLAAAVLLAMLNGATLIVAGRPWGITSAFALWGAKLALLLGLDVTAWPAWGGEAGRAALAAPIWSDVTSVMDIGIVLGACMAAALAGAFRPSLRITGRELAAAACGGLMLGYGARLAFGCNIGAYFSGVISGSPHGWAWLVMALAGTWLGTRLRALFQSRQGDIGPTRAATTHGPVRSRAGP